jgi:mono/diheme cytochrome c family protein
MKRHGGLGWLSVTAALLAAAPAAAQAADAARGQALARQWCASCHTVDAGGTATDVPPSFAAVARRRGMDADHLRGWLASPHPNMPNFELSRAAIEDLSAYILSLAR